MSGLPRRHSLFRFGFLCALSLSSAFASAQTSGFSNRAPLGESLTGAAKKAYDDAGILVNNHDFAGAITKYRQAYDLSKDARLLFDMAVCERDLRAYARMQDLLVRYEEEAGADLSAEEKAEVDAALGTIQGIVAKMRLTVNEAGASVLIDGETVGVTPLATPFAVDLGKHALSVRKSGFQPSEQTIEIPGGNEATVTITLVPEERHAQLRVTTTANATVVLDKTQVSKGGFDATVSPGAHEVAVSAPGKKTYEALLDLRNDEVRSMTVTLEDERRGLGIWPWVAGGVVVAAGAAIGGYFLFRQPTTERAPAPSSPVPTIFIPAGQ